MDAAENGGEDADGTHPAQPCNKPYDWGASLPGEFLQEIARHAGAQSWPTLRCVCQNWRRGISQAVRTVKLTVPDRSTAPALQPPAEPPAAADAPRPARRGAAAGRPAGRGGAAANQQQHQLVATGVPFTAAQRPEPETAQEPLRYQEPHPQHHPDPHQQQQHNHHHQHPQPTAATAARGFAASSGRPPPPPHPHPPDANALNAIHHQPAAATIGGPDSATAAAAAAGGGGGGDASFDRIATVVRRPPPVFEPPHHDLESLACVFNLHRQSTVAAVAAAAAAAAARLQGEASDSQAAGVASSVGSSSIVVWSFLEAADKLAMAFPLYDNLSLNFAEPLPLAACGGGGGGGGGEVCSGRWLQLEMSAALQHLLSERLASLTLSGHTPYPLFMAPPPLPLPPPPLAPLISHRPSHPQAAAAAGPQTAAASQQQQQEPHKPHHRLQRSSRRASIVTASAAAAAAAATAVAAGGAVTTAAETAAVAEVGAQGLEVAVAAGGGGGVAAAGQPSAADAAALIDPWRGQQRSAVMGEDFTVADALRALEDEAAAEAANNGPQVTVPGSSGERCGGHGAAAVGAAPNRRRRRPSPAADAPPSTTAPPEAPYSSRADKSPNFPDGPPAQRHCRQGAPAASATATAAGKQELVRRDRSPGVAAAAPPAAAAAARSPVLATANPNANWYRGSSGSAPSHGSLGPRWHGGEAAAAAAGYGTRRDADGSEAVGRERGASGVPHTPGPADVDCCCCGFEGPNSGGGGGSAGGGDGGDGGGGDPMEVGDGGAALEALMEANGSGGNSDRSPVSGDDNVENLAGFEYGRDPMDTVGDAQANVGFRYVPNHRSQPNATAVAEVVNATVAAAATTSDALLLEENSMEAGGSGSGGTINNRGGGGSSDGNGSRRGGGAAAAVQTRNADCRDVDALPNRFQAEGVAAAAAAAEDGSRGAPAAAAGQPASTAAAAAATVTRGSKQFVAADVIPALNKAAAAGPVALAAPAAAAAPPAPPAPGACAAPPALACGGGVVRAPPLLSRLSQLVSLTLVADVRFPSPQQLESITALRGLQRLDMRGAKFMQADGDASAPLGRQASWLHLGNEHVAVVARCTSLTALSLNHLHPVGGQQLVALTALSRLTALGLTDALSGNAVHGAHIQALAAGLPGLVSLDIGRVTCPPLHLPPQQQPQQQVPPQPPQPQQQPPALCGGGSGGGGGETAAAGVRSSSPSANLPYWQPWGPVLGLFQRLTSLHLQVACSFETELLSGVAALPLLERLSMELLDVPPPQLAAMLEVLTAGGPDGGGGGGADSGSPPPPPAAAA